RTLGLADMPLEQIIAGWAAAHRLGFDIVRTSGPSDSSIFVEALGIGVFGRLMAELDAQDNDQLAHLESPREKIAHVQKALRDSLRGYAAKRLRVTLDGQDISDEYIL